MAEAGAREVKEETGLTVRTDSMKLLALWESCYPTYLYVLYISLLKTQTTNRSVVNETTREETGDLHRQHLVIYYWAELEGSPADLKCEPQEVDAAAWLSLEQVQQVVSSSDEYKDIPFTAILVQQQEGSGTASEGECESQAIATEQIELQMSLGQLMDKQDQERVARDAKDSHPVVESLALGTLYVLDKWAKSKAKDK